MSRATLLLAVEGGADVQRTLGRVVGHFRSANAAINADTRRSESDRSASGMRAQAALMNAETARTRVALREAAQRSRSERQAATEIRNRANEETRIAEAAAAARNRLRSREEREENAAADRIVAIRERSERRVTAAFVAEQRARARARRESEREAAGALRTGGRIVSAVAGAAMGFASDMHGQIQGARQTRAATSHTLNSALYQAGAGGADAGALRARVFEFARQTGMRSEDLAAGINAAQTEFSTLGNSRSTQAERSANLEQMLQTSLLARNTGQDPGEVLRVAGLLQNAGITGGAQRATLLGLTGMAQRGAIELSGVSREAMQPIMARMHDARARLLQHNPNASADEIADAQRGGMLNAFAEIEVARGQGQGARRFANATSALTQELEGSHRQSLLRTNIQNAHDITGQQRTQLLGMFDRSGHLREQFTTGLGFASRVSEVLGGNEAAMRNIFTGGGHGNPRSLLTNWQSAVSAMMGGGDDVRRMVAGVGHDFTEEDVNRGAGLFGSEDMTELNRNQEMNITALSDNTNALVRASNEVANWSSRNPFQAAAAQQGAGLAQAGIVAGAAALVPAVARTIVGAGGAAAGAASTMTGGLGLAASAGLVGLAGAAGLGVGELITRGTELLPGHGSGLRGRSFGLGTAFGDIWRGATGRADATFSERNLAQDARGAIAQAGTSLGGAQGAAFVAALTQALERAHIQATVSPADAAHIAADNASGPGGAPGPPSHQ